MVRRWDVITIGSLSRNRYWGESEERPRRKAVCTCTLIRGDGFDLLVDPSLADGEAMREELDRRTGLTPADITAVFVTHHHGDHHYGLRHFPGARWLAAPPVVEQMAEGGQYARRLEPAAGSLFGAMQIVPTPGHTAEHHSLLFTCDELAVVVAGDAVMTHDFWHDRRGHYNSADADQASRTIEALAGLADIVVPGHDNYFLTGRHPE